MMRADIDTSGVNCAVNQEKKGARAYTMVLRYVLVM